jgi:hypothetical protein
MSNVQFSVLLPNSWITLLGKGFGQMNNDWEAGAIVLALLTFIILSKFLTHLGASSSETKVLALLVALICLFNDSYFYALLWFLGVAFLLRWRQKIFNQVKEARPLKLILVLGSVFAIGVVSLILLQGFMTRVVDKAIVSESVDSYDRGASPAMEMAPEIAKPQSMSPMLKKEAMLGDVDATFDEGGASGGGFVGVPAPLKIPDGLRWKTFSVESLEFGKDIKLSIILLNQIFSNIVLLICFGGAALGLWRLRKKLFQWLNLEWSI